MSVNFHQKHMWRFAWEHLKKMIGENPEQFPRISKIDNKREGTRDVTGKNVKHWQVEPNQLSQLDVTAEHGIWQRYVTVEIYCQWHDGWGWWVKCEVTVEVNK